MLEIRNEQMDVLEKAVVEAYIAELVSHFRRSVPSRVSAMPDRALAEFCRRGVSRAREYGLDDRWDMCRFIGFQLLCGEAFELTAPGAWALETLRDEALNPTERMDYMDYYYVRVLGQHLEEDPGPSVPRQD